MVMMCLINTLTQTPSSFRMSAHASLAHNASCPVLQQSSVSVLSCGLPSDAEGSQVLPANLCSGARS